MKYLLSKQFTQIAETTGTIQNSSHVGTIEMSTSNTPDSGILIYPLQKVSFSDQTIYLRCIDGYAEARVLPFELVTEGGDMQVLKRVFADISYSGSNLAFLSPTGEVLKYFNLPEEIYLRSIGTTFAPNFTWSALTYPNSINPNLNGKPVLVLHIKGDSLDSPYEDWGFCNLEDLIDLYVPADPSIAISDNSIKVAISSDTNNLLTLKNNGLFVISDKTKVDKVANATAGNIAILDANGNLVDSTFALTTLFTQYLIAGMPFTEDFIDKCGNEWTATGNPQIQDGKLYLDDSSYLQINNSIQLGGQDFTISGRFNISSSASEIGALFCIYQGTTRFVSVYIENASQLSLRVKDTNVTMARANDTTQHIEVDYSHATGVTKVFVNGTLANSINHSLSRTNLSFVAIGNGTWDTSNNFIGSVDEFQIYDGVALHTANFTPPTKP